MRSMKDWHPSFRGFPSTFTPGAWTWWPWWGVPRMFTPDLVSVFPSTKQPGLISYLVMGAKSVVGPVTRDEFVRFCVEELDLDPQQGAWEWRPPSVPKQIDYSVYGLVYFIQAGEDGPIKVGFTRRRIEARVRQISPTSPVRLRLLLTMAGTAATEKEEHSILAPYRLRGEWFHPDPALLRWIRWTRNDPKLPQEKERLRVMALDCADYAPMAGCTEGPARFVGPAERIGRNDP